MKKHESIQQSLFGPVEKSKARLHDAVCAQSARDVEWCVASVRWYGL